MSGDGIFGLKGIYKQETGGGFEFYLPFGLTIASSVSWSGVRLDGKPEMRIDILLWLGTTTTHLQSPRLWLPGFWEES